MSTGGLVRSKSANAFPAASRAMKSSGVNLRCVVPSRKGRLRASSTSQRRFRESRSSAMAGRVTALDAIRGSPSWWATCAQHMEQAFSTAVGLPTTLKQHAELTGRRSLRGTHVS